MTALVLLASLPLAARADPIVVPLPLDVPVLIPINVTPVVTIGSRTIDFTPNLNQEFIGFLVIRTSEPYGFRQTLGVRARDGLASMTGSFPLSPDPYFVNAVPAFPFGSMDLILFDAAIPGQSARFSVSLADLNGDVHPAYFEIVPEPASLLLLGTGLVGLARWRKRRH